MGTDLKVRRDEGVHRRRPGRWAWLPIPVLLTAMIVFRAAGWQSSHESVYLLLILNLVFSLLVCLVVAYLITRSFLVRSTPGLLLLGCGVVIWGPAGVVATAAARGDANASITIYNSCVWLSGLCHLAGVSLSLRARRPLSPPVAWLLAGHMEAAHDVTIQVKVCGEGTLPSESLTVFLFRAAREMLANVVRHAGVREAGLRLRRMKRYVGLCVSDRGRGFDPQELQGTAGFGLLGIRERVELLGGRIKIRSLKGRGTVVRIVVPEAREEADTTLKGGNPNFEIRSAKPIRNPDNRSVTSCPTAVEQPERSTIRQGTKQGR